MYSIEETNYDLNIIPVTNLEIKKPTPKSKTNQFISNVFSEKMQEHNKYFQTKNIDSPKMPALNDVDVKVTFKYTYDFGGEKEKHSVSGSSQISDENGNSVLFGGAHTKTTDGKEENNLFIEIVYDTKNQTRNTENHANETPNQNH